MLLLVCTASERGFMTLQFYQFYTRLLLVILYSKPLNPPRQWRRDGDWICGVREGINQRRAVFPNRSMGIIKALSFFFLPPASRRSSFLLSSPLFALNPLVYGLSCFSFAARVIIRLSNVVQCVKHYWNINTGAGGNACKHLWLSAPSWCRGTLLSRCARLFVCVLMCLHGCQHLFNVPWRKVKVSHMIDCCSCCCCCCCCCCCW